MNYNNLVLSAYNGSTLVAGAGLEDAEGLQFSSVYPGGVFEACTFFVPRNPNVPWVVKPKHKLVVYNGMDTAWEGRIVSISPSFDESRMGSDVQALGYWGDVLMARRWRKPWADARLDNTTWQNDTTCPAAEKCTYDYSNRLRITPKGVAWAPNNYAGVKYTAPTGDTVKRITFDYDLQEGAQNWALNVDDGTYSVALFSASSSGTGSQDITLATPYQSVAMVLLSGAGQTPTEDGSIYGELSNVVVYSETGTITLTEVVKDVAGHVSDLSTDYSLIATNTFSIVPFISEADTLADVLTKAASYGDASYNSWAVGVRESSLGTDNKPIMFAEQYPNTTGGTADYVVNMDELNGGFSAYQDIASVRNYIIIKMLDEAGRTAYITPDDQAALQDASSVAAYGRRDELLDLQTSDADKAMNIGRRLLAARKDPQWVVNSTIEIGGAIRTASGGVVPACQVRAGKRVKIENWLGDITSSGLVFLITGTSYDDATETVSLSVGQPSMIDNLLANVARFITTSEPVDRGAVTPGFGQDLNSGPVKLPNRGQTFPKITPGKIGDAPERPPYIGDAPSILPR